jgi:hypothetical protein
MIIAHLIRIFHATIFSCFYFGTRMKKIGQRFNDYITPEPSGYILSNASWVVLSFCNGCTNEGYM